MGLITTYYHLLVVGPVGCDASALLVSGAASLLICSLQARNRVNSCRGWMRLQGLVSPYSASPRTAILPSWCAGLPAVVWIATHQSGAGSGLPTVCPLVELFSFMYLSRRVALLSKTRRQYVHTSAALVKRLGAADLSFS